ncbi:hypothetical protein DFH07DRAFT_819307 [Mycena maculata]|uniref:TPR-like protein n=1 Tax=Mycena maculata TaxID=230809 RepID=A0AAD7NDT4_9AGAR|nr:hypothetical protein DFH07DRAFT_819307 [Mycena maculata]
MSSAELKAQGNTLFTAKKFKEAGKKYTEAIQAGDEVADPEGLAVLYANRAACRLSLKRYMDAHDDAKKATKLDPTYAKAWARLASADDAMGNYPTSEDYWKHALDALPKSNLTPAEETQKAQYQAGLDAAMLNTANMKSTPIVGKEAVIVHDSQGRMPWDRAATIVDTLRVQRPVDVTSSAWVIHGAYEEFMEGVQKMKELTLNHATKEMRGRPGAVAALTNGLLRDIRVMHFTDNEFISRYNKQMEVEQYVYKPWAEAGPEVVIKEALARQRSQGWDSVRGSISLTVRAWIMRAVMDGGLRQRHDIAVEFYKRALDVLRSLRETWILAPKDDRGAVFEQSFMFGIQNHYLDEMMQSYSHNPDSELLEELFKEADRLIREVDEALRQPQSQEQVDPGFISSFYVYPRGAGFSMRGMYYNRKAMASPNDKRELHRKSALEYLKAAECFPQDDEKHPWFLNIALGNMFASHLFPLRETLDVMKKIRLSVPVAKKIWGFSSLSASGLWRILEGVGRQEDKLRGMLSQGKTTMSSFVGME